MSQVLERSSRSKSALADLTRAIDSIVRARDIDQVVEAIRDNARALISCDGIAVIRKDGTSSHYIEEDAIGPLWKGQKFPMSACISGWSMINRQTVCISDIDEDPRIPQELYSDTFVKAVAMAPVRKADPIGAIGAYWSRVHRPTEDEVVILEALANAASTAIETVQLLETFGQQGRPSPRPEPAVSSELAEDIKRVEAIAAVPAILDVALRMTGMGFAAVARVTDTRWITCQSLDPVGFGLKPGDELEIATTICNEIRSHRQPVVIDDVESDPVYRDHHTPKMYGLRSYISVPIILADGQFFGTLCAIDPKPAKVSDPMVLGTFQLFAELIAQHLDAGARLEAAYTALIRERELSELREQFIAVLGHDLRNPIAAIEAGINRLLKDGWTERSARMLRLMHSSTTRMGGLVDNVLDLARVRMGGGLTLQPEEQDFRETIGQVVDELLIAHPHRTLIVELGTGGMLRADHQRLAQLFSNLISNAITHGDEGAPVVVTCRKEESSVVVDVQNRGKTIPEELADKLFQPFRRGDTDTHSEGLGLGLFIAAEIAAAHGGEISVKSADGETTFTFEMPSV